MPSMYRVRTDFTGGTGAAQVGTMYFDASGGLTAQNAATAVRTFWDAVKGLITTGYSMQVETSVETIDVGTGQPTAVTAVTAAAVAGASASTALPYATQALIRWRTGVFVNGREIRGRTFIPGQVQTSLSGGGLAAAAKTTYDAAAAALIGDVLSDFRIYSPKNTLNMQAVTGDTWQKFAVLRSRRD